jgi:hypothetical protein
MANIRTYDDQRCRRFAGPGACQRHIGVIKPHRIIIILWNK